MSSRTRKWVTMLVRLAIAAALLIWMGLHRVIDWRSLRGLIAAWPLTASAMALFIGAALAGSWRLCVLMAPRGLLITLANSMRLTLLGTLFSVWLPAAGGDVARIFYAASDVHGRRTEVATIVLLDRAIGLLAMMMLPLLLSPFFWPTIAAAPALRFLLVLSAAVTIALVIGFAVALSWQVTANRSYVGLTKRVPGKDKLRLVLDTVHAYRHDLPALTSALAISIVAQLLGIAVIMLLVMATTGAPAPLHLSIPIILGFVANNVPLTPNGIGVGEAAFNALFTLVGAHGGAEALLGWRVLTLALAPAGLLVYLRGQGRMILTTESA